MVVSLSLPEDETHIGESVLDQIVLEYLKTDDGLIILLNVLTNIDEGINLLIF